MLVVAGARYNAGYVSSLDLLDAERTLADAELNLAQAQATLSGDQITLFLALGGGWAPEAGGPTLQAAAFAKP